MRVNGRCHCGKIEYEAEVDPAKVQICHCLDCQTLTGSAFRVTIAAPPEGFRIKSGEATIYYKVADNGSRRGHAFCSVCGSPVFRLPTDNNPNYSLRVGGLDQRAALGPPRRQIWVRRRLSWVLSIRDTPELE